MRRLKSRGKFWLVTLTALIALVFIINATLSAMLLPRLNRYLSEFSPVYAIHIDKMRVNLFRMAYGFDAVQGTMKASKKSFLDVRSIDVSIAWRELLQARILTKIRVDQANVILTKALFADAKDPKAKPKEDAKNVRDKLFPVKIAQVDLKDAAITYGNLVGQPESEMWRIRSVDGFVTNLNPTASQPFSQYRIEGELLKSGRFVASGQLNRTKNPLDWSAKAEVRNVNLPESNPALVAWVPLNFAEGHLDIFSEARSKGGKVEGYVKPYFDHAKVFENHQKFKNVKHFFIDLLAAVGNVILRRSSDKSVAAIIPFHSDGDGIEIEEGKALSSVIEHGFEKPLKKGLEHKYSL